MKSRTERKRPTHPSTGGGEAKRGKPTKLRIIGGDMRGRIVKYHGASFTRPMKDNIRENLFNILGRAVRGARCFDLFAGTGALALESISRGATEAIAVEQNQRAVRFIQENIQDLGLGNRCQVITGDTFRLAPRLLGPPQDDTPWIVYLCPPYALWSESLAGLNQLIQATLDNAPPGSVLVAETEKSFDVANLPPGDWDVRSYGNTSLAFVEPATKCGLQLPTECE